MKAGPNEGRPGACFPALCKLEGCWSVELEAALPVEEEAARTPALRVWVGE